MLELGCQAVSQWFAFRLLSSNFLSVHPKSPGKIGVKVHFDLSLQHFFHLHY